MDYNLHLRVALDESESDSDHQERRPVDSLTNATTRLFNNTLPDNLQVPKDVEFVLANDTKIEAHKFLLALRSPVFNLMFYSPISSKTDCFHEPEVDPDAFRSVLEYIYTDEIVEDLNSFSSIYRVADRFLVTSLCERLLAYLNSILTIERSILIYDEYVKLDFLKENVASDLKTMFTMINFYSYPILSSQNFLQISLESILELLESEFLTINEIDLFSCIVKWIRENLRQQQKEVNLPNQIEIFSIFKHLIRFPIMSEREFFGYEMKPHIDGFFPDEVEAIRPAESGLFSNQELEEFRTFFRTKDEKSILSTNYVFRKRNKLKIARLDFDHRTSNFYMKKIDDEEFLYDDGEFVNKDANGAYTDDRIRRRKEGNQDPTVDDSVRFNDKDERLGNMRNPSRPRGRFHVDVGESSDDESYPSDNEHIQRLDGNFQRIKPSDLQSGEEEDIKPKDMIYIYKLQRYGGTQTYENQARIDIFESLEEFGNLKKFHKKFHVHYRKNYQSYECVYPMIPLKLNNRYRMECAIPNPWNQKYNVVDFVIKQIFNENGDLDVQVDTLNGNNSCAIKIFFMYKDKASSPSTESEVMSL